MLASGFLVALLFAYAGFSKILDFELFRNQLSEITFLKKLAPFIAVILPVFEILAACLISFDRTQILGWWLASILMTAFTIYVAVMILFKKHLPCTCGGVIAAMTWKQHLLFNIFFMLITWKALYLSIKNKFKNISANKGVS